MRIWYREAIQLENFYMEISQEEYITSKQQSFVDLQPYLNPMIIYKLTGRANKY